MPTMYLPPTPVEEGAVRITAIETYIPDDLFPGLIFLRIHTDAGIIGHGETYYGAHAVQALIHDWMHQPRCWARTPWPSNPTGASSTSASPTSAYAAPSSAPCILRH